MTFSESWILRETEFWGQSSALMPLIGTRWHFLKAGFWGQSNALMPLIGTRWLPSWFPPWFHSWFPTKHPPWFPPWLPPWFPSWFPTKQSVGECAFYCTECSETGAQWRKSLCPDVSCKIISFVNVLSDILHFFLAGWFIWGVWRIRVLCSNFCFRCLTGDICIRTM